MKRVISCLVYTSSSRNLFRVVPAIGGTGTMIVEIFHESIFFFIHLYNFVHFVELDGLMKFKNFLTRIDGYLNL